METEYTITVANRGTPYVIRVLTSNVTGTNTELSKTTGRISINGLPAGSFLNLDATIARNWQGRVVT